MHPYLTITDSAALHAAVDARLRADADARDEADFTVSEVAEATSVAPFNKHLVADRWIAECVSMAADEDGMRDLPERGRACVVRASGLSFEALGDVPASLRSVVSEPPFFGVPNGLCDRCTPPLNAYATVGRAEHRRLRVFEIARGRFVVQFRVCDPCFGDLSPVGPIVEA